MIRGTIWRAPGGPGAPCGTRARGADQRVWLWRVGNGRPAGATGRVDGFVPGADQTGSDYQVIGDVDREQDGVGDATGEDNDCGEDEHGHAASAKQDGDGDEDGIPADAFGIDHCSDDERSGRTDVEHGAGGRRRLAVVGLGVDRAGDCCGGGRDLHVRPPSRRRTELPHGRAHCAAVPRDGCRSGVRAADRRNRFGRGISTDRATSGTTKVSSVATRVGGPAWMS